ncbi:MAG: DNA polymerase III subunit gamma/tau [Bacteroidia bacterium]|nr:DNA polymerase III subunit gamma/tau [Bacteroidia bacterium]
MENFIVSARKYRPSTFSTVVGQPSITQTLKNAIINHHLAQAFLFTGPRGVGKTTTARILAKTINCENISASAEACNSCPSCLTFNSGQSLNIYELDAASNNSVDDIRALVDQVRYPPHLGKYKVYIIDEVHMLSQSAFNAFLKTLEEPPSYAIFILATTEKHKIIPTILSRCQIFDFSRISVEDIAKHLAVIATKENVNAEEDALHVIAQKADGALRDALSLFDQLVSFAGNHLRYRDVITNLNVLDYDYYFRITEDLLAGNMSSVLLVFNEILNHGFDGHNFINGLASHFRDLLVCKDIETLVLLEVSQNIREKYKIQSGNCGSSWLLELLEIADKCDMGYRTAKNQRLHVELALIRMCSTGKSNNTITEYSKKKAESAAGNNSPAGIKEGAAAVPSDPAVKTTPAGGQSKSPQPVSATPQPPPVTSSPASRGTKTISISKGLYKSTENGSNQAAESLPELSGKFTQQELEIAWNDVATSVEKQGKISLHTALVKRKPELRENNKVHFVLDSAAIEKDFSEMKSELLAFLRKQLSNTQIQVETVVELRTDDTSTPYTPSEKFRKMAASNPAMHELRKRFDLDIEY